jgi:hypothetical protein
VNGFHYAGELRRHICLRNATFAQEQRIAHVTSYGAVPVTVYLPDNAAGRHGNFYAPSYRAILKRPQWASRLNKVHAQARASLPRADHRWRELDSCTSSDALLMNIFCCPGVCRDIAVARILGNDPSEVPEFGFRARVPRRSSAAGKQQFDRTEVDMKLGNLLVESKLTESDFQSAPAKLVESYSDLENVFDLNTLPRAGQRYCSYQLIRNVLAVAATAASFCVMLDERRPDLIEQWHAIMRCVEDLELRTRLKVLTWQELSVALPPGLRQFLRAKYGIAPPGVHP